MQLSYSPINKDTPNAYGRLWRCRPPDRGGFTHRPTARTDPRSAGPGAGDLRSRLQREKDTSGTHFFQGRSGRNRGACGAIDASRCAVVSGACICTESSRSPGLRRPTTYPPTLCVARQKGGYPLTPYPNPPMIPLAYLPTPCPNPGRARPRRWRTVFSISLSMQSYTITPRQVTGIVSLLLTRAQ